MNILALDLGTTTGWATNANGRIEVGVQQFDVKRGESPGMRYLRFRNWLEEIYTCLSSLDVIAYEQTHNRGGAATEVAAGFSTRVQEFCAQKNIDHIAVHSGTLKKFWTGSGRAGKQEMIEAAKKRNLSPQDDNEADALAVLHWALEEIDTNNER